MKHFFYLSMLLVAAMFASCDDKEKSETLFNVNFAATVESEITLTADQMSKIDVVFKSVDNNATKQCKLDTAGNAQIQLAEGTYNITVNQVLEVADANNLKVTMTKENVSIETEGQEIAGDLTVAEVVEAGSDLIISEYVEGYSNNKAIEIFNPTTETINLKNYKLVRYANGEDVPPADDKWSMNFPDYELEPYKVYVAVLDKRDPDGTGQQAPLWWDLEVRADEFFNTNYSVSNTLYFNGDDAIALEKLDGTLVDLFGRWGAPCPADVLIAGSTRKDGAWTDVAPYYNGEGRGITADHTLVRKSNINKGVNENPVLFNALAEHDTLVANTFTGLGWHKFDGAPANTLPVVNMDTLYTVSPIAADGDVVLTINATDTDADQKLEFYLTEGNTVRIGEEGSYEYLSPFELERSTGKLIVADENAIAEATMDIYIEFVVCDEYGQTEPSSFKVKISD